MARTRRIAENIAAGGDVFAIIYVLALHSAAA
jgi:hypothetical protein